eukprot:GSChrysophyteH2.ASY1.ANO1.1074.1 assembled CDS
MEANLRQVLHEIEKHVGKKGSSMDNATKKKLWSKLEIAIIDAEGSSIVDNIGKVLDGALEEKIVTVRKILALTPAYRPFRWWFWLDIWFRFAGVCCGFFTISLLSLPIIFMQTVDNVIGSDPFHRISETMRASIAQFMLVLAGVTYEVQGLDIKTQFNAACVIYSFTHASNLDGLLVSSTCPVRHFAIAKKELFFVPFFSWISFAIGGVPVDRENRDRAIGSLNRAAKKAEGSKACIVMAPEGTRSKHGNLQDYKKGMFHMQAQLDAPIVPFVIDGGFDIYPVGSWVNQCGHVVVRYLPPITSADASNREDMRRLCRRRVLTALADTPAGCGADLPISRRLLTYF